MAYRAYRGFGLRAHRASRASGFGERRSLVDVRALNPKP